ncbi:hypothetical protein D3C80_1050370 [compost metagenome]
MLHRFQLLLAAVEARRQRIETAEHLAAAERFAVQQFVRTALPHRLGEIEFIAIQIGQFAQPLAEGIDTDHARLQLGQVYAQRVQLALGGGACLGQLLRQNTVRLADRLAGNHRQGLGSHPGAQYNACSQTAAQQESGKQQSVAWRQRQ